MTEKQEEKIKQEEQVKQEEEDASKEDGTKTEEKTKEETKEEVKKEEKSEDKKEEGKSDKTEEVKSENKNEEEKVDTSKNEKEYDIVVAKPNSLLQKELDDATFSIFSDISDLGYFSWEPTGPYKKLIHASSTGIRHYLQYNGTPNGIVSVESLQKRCPLKLMKLTPVGKDSKYPYDTPLITALHVMYGAERRDTYDDINFVFFGAPILDLLATTKVDSNYDYVAQLIPGTKNMIGIKAVRTTRKNLGAHQTQFEKLSYGKHLSAPITFDSTFHLQLMTIGRDGEQQQPKAKILFASESIAMDVNTGLPVEVKLMDATSAAKCMKTSFQMISSGSVTLYAGEVNKAVLTDVKKLSLSEAIAVGISKPNYRRGMRRNNRSRNNNRDDTKNTNTEDAGENKEEKKDGKEDEKQTQQQQEEEEKKDGEDDDANHEEDEDAAVPGGVKEYEENILTGLAVLQNAVKSGKFDNGKLMHIAYFKGSLIVYPESIFPGDETVVPDLLQRVQS